MRADAREQRRARHLWVADTEQQGIGPAWPLALPVAIYLALFLALVWPWVLGYVTIPWDAKAHFLPQVQFLAQSLARGEAPWWNPYVFAGQPQVADPQSLIFSPPYLLLAFFEKAPSFAAFDAVAFCMLAAGGLAIIAMFRDHGWRPEGAVVAALAFALGASAAWRIQHIGQILSLAWFAIALWLLLRAVDRRSILWGSPASPPGSW